MLNYWEIVNEVLRKSDIVLLVMDARFPAETRNHEIERKVLSSGKKLLYVLNKSDLVPEGSLNKIMDRYDPGIYVSVRDHMGGTKLFRKILELSKGEQAVVGIVGYPNVGKSSIANLLKGKKSAKTSSFAGFTHGVQKLSARGKILLLDTPGVLPYHEKDILKQLLIGAINPQEAEQPEYYAMKLIRHSPILFEKRYGIVCGDAEKALHDIAVKTRTLMKGGEPDTERAARKIIQDWQSGKFHSG